MNSQSWGGGLLRYSHLNPFNHVFKTDGRLLSMTKGFWRRPERKQPKYLEHSNYDEYSSLHWVENKNNNNKKKKTHFRNKDKLRQIIPMQELNSTLTDDDNWCFFVLPTLLTWNNLNTSFIEAADITQFCMQATIKKKNKDFLSILTQSKFTTPWRIMPYLNWVLSSIFLITIYFYMKIYLWISAILTPTLLTEIGESIFNGKRFNLYLLKMKSFFKAKS